MREAVLLEHGLDHLDAVLVRVEGRLGEQDLVLCRIDFELLEKCIVPDVTYR